MSDISREELVAFTEANTKSAVALDKITQTLEAIAQKQDRMLEKVTNGVSTAIVDGVNDHYSNTHKETVLALDRIEANQKSIKDAIDLRVPLAVDEKLKNSSIAKDVEHTKWLVGIVGFIVVVCVVLMRVIGNTNTEKALDSHTAVLEDLLRAHIHETGGTGGK